MSTGNTKRTRTTRVGGFALPPGQVSRFWQSLRSREVLIRLGLCILAAGVMWAVTRAWAPPFSYRTGYVPPRDIHVRTPFKVYNQGATQDKRKQRQQEMPWIYENDPAAVLELRQRLKTQVRDVLQAGSADKVDAKLWKEFLPPSMQDDPEDPQRIIALFGALAEDKELSRFDAAVRTATSSWEMDGLLRELQHTQQEGSQVALLVYSKGNPALKKRVEIDRVRLAEVMPRLPTQLQEAFIAQKFDATQAEMLSKLLGGWFKEQHQKQALPNTLTANRELSLAEIDKELKAVEVNDDYTPGKLLAPGNKPLGDDSIALLRKEHEAYLHSLTRFDRLGYSLASLGMYAAMFTLCGVYIQYRRPRLIADLRRLTTLLLVVIATVTLAWLTAADTLRAEIVPLLLFGMMMAIAYDKELALLLATSVALIVAFSLEQGLPEFVILASGVAAAILLLGRIRSRTKLIYVSLLTGVVVMLTVLGVGTLAGQAYCSGLVPEANDTFLNRLLLGSLWFGFFSLVAGVLMSGLLPFIERMFEVQTDISLLELGDAAHPLLQELVRRAPGTYNHSINVASIGEAAAEAIGGNGLLVRVGAYFHDIGKMLKPQYFVENQGSEGNRHESLAPAMSTLVIIAHVKDGIDLARQHRLPETIVDFIAQHHGTTLVEYFYRRAAKQLENDPDAADLDESHFRYPGPKPQSKETAVLMLADVVESASRALVDPAPARIESLVHDLALKRLLDGQFDECGLTLQELHLIEESLVKSVTAVYHGRVKYPEHQTV
jgi:putative nucleotidyltransferase with HDIG domain